MLVSMWGIRYTHTLQVGKQNGKTKWKAVLGFLRKLVMETPFEPIMPLLGSNPNDLKSAYSSDTDISQSLYQLNSKSNLCALQEING